MIPAARTRLSARRTAALNHYLRKFSPDGKQLAQIAGGGLDGLYGPTPKVVVGGALAVDAAGDVFETERLAHVDVSTHIVEFYLAPAPKKKPKK